MGIGNYTSPTRTTGTVITDTVYNDDHQVHRDNMNCLGVDDLSADATEMQGATDPGTDSSESLATDLAGELKRLRNEMKVIKTALQGGQTNNYWYTDLTDEPLISFTGAYVYSNVAQEFADIATITLPLLKNDGNWEALSFTHSINLHPSTAWAVGDPTKLVAPVTGYYHVGCRVEWDAGTDAGLRAGGIRVNGTSGTLALIDVIPAAASASNGQLTQNLSTIIKLTAADYVEFLFQQDSGAAIDVTQTDSSHFAFMALIGG